MIINISSKFRGLKTWPNFTAQKSKFSMKDFFSKCDQIHRKLQIWSHLLEKSSMENLIFCTVFGKTSTASYFGVIMLLSKCFWCQYSTFVKLILCFKLYNFIIYKMSGLSFGFWSIYREWVKKVSPDLMGLS